MSPELYTKVSLTKLKQLTECLYYCLELPVRAMDENGAVLCGYGTSSAFCLSFKKLIAGCGAEESSCHEIHAEAVKYALTLGKPYVFSCHAELNHLVFPLISDYRWLGGIMVGPFLTDPMDQEVLSETARRYRAGFGEAQELFEALDSIPVTGARKAGEISRLISCVFGPLISGDPAEPQPLQTAGAAVPGNSSPDEAKGPIELALSYIEKNYDRELSLSETARVARLSPSYFSTLFKHTRGLSFKEYLNHIRIEKAKSLLTNTSHSIMDISLMVGYEDSSYFTRVFKKYTGLTPKQYRN